MQELWPKDASSLKCTTNIYYPSPNRICSGAPFRAQHSALKQCLGECFHFNRFTFNRRGDFARSRDNNHRSSPSPSFITARAQECARQTHGCKQGVLLDTDQFVASLRVGEMTFHQPRTRGGVMRLDRDYFPMNNGTRGAVATLYRLADVG